MACVNIANREGFQKEPKILAQTKGFIATLQALEFRLDKIETPPGEHASILKEYIKNIKEYLAKMLGEKYNSLAAHCSHLKGNFIKSAGFSEKKEILKNEIQYLKNYISTQEGIYWDEMNHTDILYIYWHSKNELEIIEKITVCLDFLNTEIINLETQQCIIR